MTADERIALAKMGNPESPANGCSQDFWVLAMAGLGANITDQSKF
jgi:hypothetical protein